MIAEVIRIKDNVFVPTVAALAVPELKELWENVEHPELYFLYIHNYLYPTSAYAEVEESEKKDLLLRDFPIDEEDPFFIAAFEKCEKLYETPLKRGFLATKIAYDILSRSMSNTHHITFGRDGNASEVASFIKNSEQFMKAYMSAMNTFKDQLKSYGSKAISDEDEFDYDDGSVDLNLA